MAHEKRTVERKPCQKLIRFQGEGFHIYSRILDLSPKGAFVATHYLLDPGTPIEILLSTSDTDAAKGQARVVHSSTLKKNNGEEILGLGIEFTKPLSHIDA